MRYLILLFIVSVTIGAEEISLLNGYEKIKWGDGFKELPMAYPQCLGLIKTANGNGLYLIKKDTAFIFSDDKVKGIIFGDLIGFDALSAIGISGNWNGGKLIADGISYGMPFSRLVTILSPNEKVNPDYRVEILKNDVYFKLQFSSSGGVAGEDRFTLNGLTVIKGALPDFNGGLKVNESGKLF